jgi:pantoate--beta-alanine ligase
MSSRNRYLTPEQRKQALVLSRSLDQAEQLRWNDVTKIRQTLTATISAAPDAVIDYIAVADPKTLRELDRIDPAQTPEVVVLLAVKIGDTRLIDNRIYSPF